MTTVNKTKLTGYDPNYHDRQFASPYQSTIAFCDWLDEQGFLNESKQKLCDFGCGKGANLYYMANRYPSCHLVGVDIDESLIDAGQTFFQRKAIVNCELRAGNILNDTKLFAPGSFDGIVSYQTLSWLPGYEEALDAFIRLDPSWVAFSSLFYDGCVEAKTVITQYEDERDLEGKSFYYNTYSLTNVKRYLADRGYASFVYHRFEMPIDIPNNSSGRMGTYTEKVEDGRRLQVSGPLLMNWYFVAARKDISQHD